MKNQILITGATGLIGKILSKKFIERGDKVIAITRGLKHSENTNLKFVNWENTEMLKSELQNVDAVIHLSGENVMSKRWSDTHKKNIYNSRINSTKKIVGLISESEKKPECFICASAIGYYGTGTGNSFTENSPAGTDFLAGVSKDWEAEAKKVESVNVRHVSLRTGIVLTKEGGALKKMLTPFKLFLGGPLGSGMQAFPWIHIDDIVGLIIFAIDNKKISGPINGVAPEQITMNEFCNTLGNVLRRPSFFKVPGFAIKLLYGEGAGAVLSGNYIIPDKALKKGFNFSYKISQQALQNLLR